MKSPYKKKQISQMSELIYKKAHLSGPSADDLAEHLYDNNCRVFNRLFLTIHILLGTFHVFFLAPLVMIMVCLYWWREMVSADPYWLVFPAIPFSSIVAMVIHSYLSSKTRMK